MFDSFRGKTVNCPITSAFLLRLPLLPNELLSVSRNGSTSTELIVRLRKQSVANSCRTCTIVFKSVLAALIAITFQCKLVLFVAFLGQCH